VYTEFSVNKNKKKRAREREREDEKQTDKGRWLEREKAIDVNGRAKLGEASPPPPPSVVTF